MNDNLVKAEILFFDDFKVGELDRARWNVRTTGKIYNNEQQAYVDSDETIYIAPAESAPGGENGVLVIQPRYHLGFTTPEGERFDFISGRIDTKGKFEFSYGTAAARIKLPHGAGLWPAFWLIGGDKWPQSGEIDVMESVGEPDWISAAVHGPGFCGEAGLVNKLFFPDPNDATAWHIYAVDWTRDKIIFKVDGTIIYRLTRPMIAFFGPWVFDNKKHLILNFALGGTYPYKTNGVETPYYGLPDTTVKKIKDNQIKVLVDWVKVSRKNE